MNHAGRANEDGIGFAHRAPKEMPVVVGTLRCRRLCRRTVNGTEFVRGFLQHTLPSGFQKIRYYGWMSANSKISMEEVRWLVWLFLGWTFWLASGHKPQDKPSQKTQVRCAQCGSTMRVIAITFEPRGLLSEHALSYLDSG